MPWTETARREYRRDCPRYSSDLTDREWALIEPFMPPPCRIGCPRKTDLREVVNAVLYMASTGCQWRQLAKDFPPVSTVQHHFYEWRDNRLWQTIRFHLAVQAREREGREAQPSAGVIGSQMVKTTEAGGVSGAGVGRHRCGRRSSGPRPNTGRRRSPVSHRGAGQGPRPFPCPLPGASCGAVRRRARSARSPAHPSPLTHEPGRATVVRRCGRARRRAPSALRPMSRRPAPTSLSSHPIVRTHARRGRCSSRRNACLSASSKPVARRTCRRAPPWPGAR